MAIEPRADALPAGAAERLRTALSAEPVTLASIPPRLARDWLLPDGGARVQVMPKPEAQAVRGLRSIRRRR